MGSSVGSTVGAVVGSTIGAVVAVGGTGVGATVAVGDAAGEAHAPSNTLKASRAGKKSFRNMVWYLLQEFG
jgi:hypothetical protein